MPPAIEVENVSKTYGSGAAAVRALEGVSLSVAAGEVVLLMGPSGSGKTTLLSVMGCILRPTSGRVWVAGRDVTRLGERQLPAVRLNHIGFIFQGFNLFSTLTAGENLELALDLKGVRGAEARRRAAALLGQVGLEGKYGAYPWELSGGQKQRVAIARALSAEPQVILADEPTAALDSRSGQAVVALLRRLAGEQGRGVVIVTHDHRMEEFADRIVRLADGRLAAAGQQDGMLAGAPPAPEARNAGLARA